MQFGGRCGVAAQALAASPDIYDQLIQPLGDRAQAQGNYYVDFEPRLFWHGYSLNVHGAEQTLMLRHPGNPNVPSAAHAWVAQDGWVFSCIPADSGEGFLGLDSQGNKYYFNHLASLAYEPVHQAVADPYAPPCELGCGYPRYVNAPLGPKLARSEIRLYATRVEDRFGNWVAYDYDAQRLTRIRASDGREIALGYDARGVVSQATVAGRSWTYAYQQVAAPAEKSDRVLKSVALPDGSAWNYSLDQLGYAEAVLMADDGWRLDETDCGQLGPEPGLFNGNAVFTGSVTAPSGARYEYKLRPTRHHLTYVDEIPQGGGTCYGGSAIPRLFDVVSLTERNVTGPGLATLKWTYAYQQPRATFRWECAQDPSICSDRKSVQITGPDGTISTQQFGAMRTDNAGMLLGEQIARNGVLYRDTSQTYQTDPTGQPYPARIGLPSSELRYYPEVLPLSGRNQPLKRISLIQDGVTFQRDTTQFDRFARPLTVTRHSSLGFSRTDTTEYADDLSRWMLGQVARSTSAGIETERTEFDGNAMPWKIHRHGQLQQTLAYNGDGTLASVSDGRGMAVLLSNWKRGLPQRIQHPATPESPSGAVESATVDDAGWITSAIDENGYATAYTHDAMGRVASVVHPSGDSVAWNATTQSFTRSANAEHGLPAGHWQQTATTGNARKITYFDALLRPVVVQEQDVASPAASTRWSAKRYDERGREVFSAYPSNPHVSGWKSYADTGLAGVSSVYDPLDRPISQVQSSELGALTTTIQYLPGFKRRTINPRGIANTESFQVFDQPSYESPVQIDVADNTNEKARTIIVRDSFGKPQEVNRGPGN